MATLLTIAQLGAPVLRQSAHVVTHNDPHLAALLPDMLHTLETSGGVGLAAPQVYEPVRLIIVASRPTARYPDAPLMSATVMINPTVTLLSDSFEKGWEGCLSIPGIRAQVPRAYKVGVSYTTLEGKRQDLEVDGFVARIVQHEFDHLNGLVFLDRVENNRDIISEAEYFNL